MALSRQPSTGKPLTPFSRLGDARRQIGHHRLVHPTLGRLTDILSLDLDRNMANTGCPHGCPAQNLPQSGAGAADHRHTRNSPWPDVFRPPTSSKKAVSTAGKAWMTGTSPVKGTWSYSRIAANNRFPSTGQPCPDCDYDVAVFLRDMPDRTTELYRHTTHHSTRLQQRDV